MSEPSPAFRSRVIARALCQALESASIASSPITHQCVRVGEVGDPRCYVIIPANSADGIASEVLNNTLAPVLIGTTNYDVANVLACPRLARRSQRVEIHHMFLRVLGCVSRKETASTAAPTVCSIPCVFDNALKASLATLEHDRFGRFITYGLGKRICEGAADREDLDAIAHYAADDALRLEVVGAGCPHLAERAHPASTVLELLTSCVTASRDATSPISQTGTVIRDRFLAVKSALRKG